MEGGMERGRDGGMITGGEGDRCGAATRGGNRTVVFAHTTKHVSRDIPAHSSQKEKPRWPHSPTGLDAPVNIVLDIPYHTARCLK